MFNHYALMLVLMHLTYVLFLFVFSFPLVFPFFVIQLLKLLARWA